jgi:two-component system NtrC family sensor kinase
MTSAATPRPLTWLPKITPVAALAVIAIALLALVGWTIDNGWLTRLGPSGPSMNPLTAATLILAAVGLLVGGLRMPAALVPALHFIRRACGVAVAVIGVVKAIEYLSGWTTGIDRFFFTSVGDDNQIAPNTATGLVLVGAALAVMEVETRRGWRPAQALAVLSLILTLLALVGYAYEIRAFYRLREYIPMAMNTALALLLLTAGVLAARPDRGLMQALSSPGPGGALLRGLLPAGFLIPGLLGWLCLAVQRDDDLSTAAAIALFAVANMIMFTAGVIATAGMLDRAERRRRSAEELLLAERHLLRELLDHLPDSIFFKDRDSRFTRINRALARRLGLKDPAEAIGKTDFDFFTEEHAQPAFDDEQEVLRTGEPFAGKEEKETWADGRQRWVLTTRLPLRDPAGTIVGTFGIARDITERKRAEAVLKQTEERQRLLLESTGEGIYGTDADGNCTFINPAAAEMLGYRPDELHGKNMHDLIHYRRPDGTPYPIEECPIYNASRTGQSRRVAHEAFWRKDGTSFPVEYAGYPLRAEGTPSRGAVVTFTDNTERERMRALLMQSEKLASIGLLSAGIAHEINNPLAYVANNLAVLQRDFKGLMGILDAYEKSLHTLTAAEPEAARQIETLAEELDLPYVRENLERVLTRTREGVQRVTSIVQGLRSLARTDRPQLESAHLPELVEMALELIRERLRRRGITIVQEYGPGLKLRCVSTQIGQVMLNLLTNAMQAIEGSGRAGGRIRIAARHVGAELQVEIEDNGNGIDPQHLQQIFDPFFTTKPVGEGTGLGLAITHGIVTGHGGHIEVRSQLGEGTCFRLHFPVNPPRPG